jgi:hypothetical protein
MARTGVVTSGGALAIFLLTGCGGGGGGGAQTSTIKGHISSASTASVRRSPRSWLAWAGEEVLGLAKRALANTALGGIMVQANSSNGRSVAEMTDDAGEFDLSGAPTGNLIVTFNRGGCQGEVFLPDVATESTVTLRDVAFDCTGARPSKVSETFRAVVINVPASQNGNLVVCVASGGGSRTRVVKIKDALIQDANGNEADFSDLADGKRIEVAGEREGLGTSSALEASNLRILGTGNPAGCSGQPVPTALASRTPTPEATATPTATPTPTPTP